MTELAEIGLKISKQQCNITIRNLRTSKVLATTGDVIGIQSSYNIWIDHVDLSSDRDHDKVWCLHTLNTTPQG